jgi:acetylornithine deacetylase/succinyl-diaminopimelate desuccinylase-like protein
MHTREDILRDLKEFISFPSISADSRQQQSIFDCASWLAGHLYEIGIQKVKVFPTSAHPVVYGEYTVNAALPTILFYGHYDVTPVDPLSKWETPPFRPAIKGHYIVGRGASDDKGQLFTHIKAVARLLHPGGRLPVNVKFLIEGAEEIGSLGLEEFIRQHKEMLRCDAVVVSDTKMAGPGQPAITYSLRGSVKVEVELRTMARDLHSGTFGGYVPNAAIKIAEFIAGLHNEDRSIAIPGFYEDVRNLSPAEKAFITVNGISNAALIQEAAAFAPWGERGYTMYERITSRPSLTVTGITAGYQEKGFKEVIPAVASAKLNFRLVPDQDPERICRLLEQHVRNKIADADVRITYGSLGYPVTIPRHNFYIRAAAKACEMAFRRKPRFLQNGGSIGAVDYLYSILGVPVVLLGFARADDNMHAPNEKFYLPDLFKGIDTIQHFLILCQRSSSIPTAMQARGMA